MPPTRRRIGRTLRRNRPAAPLQPIEENAIVVVEEEAAAVAAVSPKKKKQRTRHHGDQENGRDASSFDDDGPRERALRLFDELEAQCELMNRLMLLDFLLVS